MSDPTWQEAITPVTQPEYVDIELAALEAAGSPINGWSPDAPQRALVEGEATAGAAESAIISNLAKTASPVTCADAGSSWVDAVMGWFDIDRHPAVEAVWDITLVCEASVSPLTINATNAGQIQAMANDGTIFLCTQESSVVLNGASSNQGTIRFTARVAGESGNVTQDTILRLISAPSGLDILAPGSGGVQTAITVGADEETDADYITRGLGRWGVIFGNPNGTAGWTRTSFDFLIPYYGFDLDASPQLAVTRWSVDDANPYGPGTVSVTLANASGPATVDEVAAVDAGLNSLDVKPVGSGALTVAAAASHPLAITATIQVDGSIPQLTIKAAAEAALTKLGQRFPIGIAKLVPDLVSEILRGAALTTVAVQTGVTSKNMTLDLPGFASVQEVVLLSLASPEIIGPGDVLEITPTVTVLG